MSEELFKATIVFPSREMARQLAIKWSRRTRRGYSLGPAQPDGSASLTLDGITTEYREWLDAEVAKINAELES